MKFLRRLVAATVVSAMVMSTSVNAAEYYDNCGGCGYEECRRAPCIAPCVALGVIALAAIIAVAVQNSSCDHSHSHN
jgi:hypothetical protein